MRAVAVLATFVAFSATAEPLTEVPFSVPCKGGVCIIQEAMLDAILETNAGLAKEIESLREQVKKPVECAKTEITEPSKEKEAPLKPPFKLERNS